MNADKAPEIRIILDLQGFFSTPTELNAYEMYIP